MSPRKSQIAIEYAYRLRESSPQTWVFWIHAADTPRFEEGFKAIADKVNLPGRDNPKVDILKLVYNWLTDERNGQWLLILDNADDDGPFFDPGRPLEGFLPQTPNGKLLITSRKRSAATNLVGSQGHSLQVEPMGEGDALTLLNTRGLLDEFNHDDAKALVEALEYIPLAITHAAACIKASALMTMTDYIRRFEESESHLVNVLGREMYKEIRRDNSIRHTVIATWQISFAQIQEVEPLAASLLALMSMLDRQGIPLSLMESLLEEPLDLDKLLTVLVDFSLVRIEIGKQSASMHRLVQLSMKKWLEADRDATLPKLQSRSLPNATFPGTNYATFATCALLCIAYSFPLTTFETRAICSKYLPHAYAVLNNYGNGPREGLSAKGMLLYKIASYFSHEGWYKLAEQRAYEVLTLCKEAFGPDDYRTMTSMSLLGDIYLHHNEWEKAEQSFVESLEMRKRVFGELHINTMETVSDLSKLYYNQGKYNKAKDFGVQAFEARKKAYGEDHQDTLTEAKELGLVYKALRRLEKAEELMLQSLKGHKRIFGNKHPRTQAVMVLVGAIYLDQGRSKEAEGLMLQAIQYMEDIPVEDGFYTVFAMEDLVDICIDQGRLEEAGELCIELLADWGTRLGKRHPERLKIMCKLAWIHAKKNESERGAEC